MSIFMRAALRAGLFFFATPAFADEAKKGSGCAAAGCECSAKSCGCEPGKCTCDHEKGKDAKCDCGAACNGKSCGHHAHGKAAPAPAK